MYRYLRSLTSQENILPPLFDCLANFLFIIPSKKDSLQLLVILPTIYKYYNYQVLDIFPYFFHQGITVLSFTMKNKLFFYLARENHFLYYYGKLNFIILYIMVVNLQMYLI